MSEHTISAAGDPFTATSGAAEKDERLCVCNDGWVTIGHMVVDEETEEFALYLCRRCSG